MNFDNWVFFKKRINLLLNVSIGCLLFNSSGSEHDSLDGISEHVPCCPLTPSLSPRKRTTSQSKTEPPLLRTSKRTIYTAGRPPWYNVTGTTFKEAFVIGETTESKQNDETITLRLNRSFSLVMSAGHNFTDQHSEIFAPDHFPAA